MPRLLRKRKREGRRARVEKPGEGGEKYSNAAKKAENRDDLE